MAGIHISAVICTHERYELCRKAIESLLRQTNAGGSYETIVVDNSSSAEEANRFAASFAGRPVKFLHTTSVGLSNARNIGARAAAGDVVAYLDDDAEASPDWVSAVTAAFAAYPARAGVVGGPVKPIWIEPRPAWMDERFLEIFAIIDRGPRMRSLDAGEWLAGCNIAFARDALLEVGGFDVGLGRIGGSLLSNEETAVCDRIRKLGREVIYAPDVVVGHVVPPERATVDYVRRRVAWQAASDALAYPERSRGLANSNRENWGPLGGLFKAVRLSRVMGTKRASMTRADYDLVYDLVNQLLSRESGRR